MTSFSPAISQLLLLFREPTGTGAPPIVDLLLDNDGHFLTDNDGLALTDNG
jgi:hypothetical protein